MFYLFVTNHSGWTGNCFLPIGWTWQTLQSTTPAQLISVQTTTPPRFACLAVCTSSYFLSFSSVCALVIVFCVRFHQLQSCLLVALSLSLTLRFSPISSLSVLPPLDFYMNSCSFYLLSLRNSISISLYFPLWLPPSLLRPSSLFLFSTLAVLCSTLSVRLSLSLSVSLSVPSLCQLHFRSSFPIAWC